MDTLLLITAIFCTGASICKDVKGKKLESIHLLLLAILATLLKLK